MYTGGQSLSESSGRAWANLLEVELSPEIGPAHAVQLSRARRSGSRRVLRVLGKRPECSVVSSAHQSGHGEGLLAQAARRPLRRDRGRPDAGDRHGRARLRPPGHVHNCDWPRCDQWSGRRRCCCRSTVGRRRKLCLRGRSITPGIFSFTFANEVMSQAAALSRASTLLDPAWERGVLWTEQPVANAGTMACGAPTSSEVQILSEDGSDVNLRVHADRSMALVAAYAFHDGWSAWLDDHEVPMLRAYGGLMTISVPPGSHSVVFGSRSRTLPVGLVIFAVSGSVLLVGTMRSRRRPAVIETD